MMNQRPNAERKTKSTKHQNGGEAITMMVNAIQLRTFRERKSHRPLMRGEIAIAKSSKADPEKSDSPEAKYNAIGFTAEIVSGGKHSPNSYRVASNLAISCTNSGFAGN